MTAWAGWDVQLLNALKGPVNDGSLKFLDEWHGFEESGARNNPLNTTEPWPRSTVYNPAGVRNYASRADGIAATVKTLENGRYPALLRALQGATMVDDATVLAVAKDLTTWGSVTFAHVYYHDVTGKELDDALAAEKPAQTAQTGASPDRQIVAAWNRLSRVLAWGVPDQLKNVRASSARIRKAVR